MKAHTASFINAVVLIAMSIWAYVSSDTPSMTALIPGAFGVLLIACGPGVKAENKIVAHVAALLTVLLIVALLMPLKGTIVRNDYMALVRVAIMLMSSVFAMTMFIKSFVEVRQARRSS